MFLKLKNQDVNSSLRSWLRYSCFFALVMAMLGFFISAYAQDNPSFIFLNGVDQKFHPLQNTWGTIIRTYAQRLFWGLAAVDFSWTTITYILDKNDISEMLGSLVRKVMTLGFFFTLLKMSDTWIPNIIASFKKIGMQAGSVDPASTTPDGIVALGFNTALSMFSGLGEKGLLKEIALVFPVTILAFLVFISFLFVACQLLVTLIESYIAIGGGVILLGFGGSRWTTDIASKYMQYAVATGLKLMVLYLIVGAGQTLFDNALWIDPQNIIVSCLQAAGEALVYAYLAIQIPQIASAMMSGAPSLTAGGMAGAALGAGAAIAAASATTGKLAHGGVNAASGAVAGASGLAKALSAGVSSGLDLGKSGINLAAHTLGQIGSHGLGLAKGTIGDAIGGARTSFAQKADHSMGGKIASSIEATRGGSMAGVGAPAPSTSASLGQREGQGSTTAQSQWPTSTQENGSGGNTPATDNSAVTASTAGISAPTTPQARPASTSAMSDLSGRAAGNNSADSSTSPSAPLSVPTTSAVNSGDGSTVAVTDGRPSSGNLSNKNSRNLLHKRIQELQGYVPQDVAHAATLEIELKHTED